MLHTIVTLTLLGIFFLALPMIMVWTVLVILVIRQVIVLSVLALVRKIKTMKRGRKSNDIKDN